MAYTKHNWECGETITADLLNNLEEGVEEALECCGSKGYECTSSKETAFEGNLTTEDGGRGFASTTFTPTKGISGNSIFVAFDGREVELPKAFESDETVIYGEIHGEAPIFTNYPCVVVVTPKNVQFVTETAGTYAVKIESNIESVETDECFEKAVKSVVDVPLIVFVDDGGSCGTGEVVARFLAPTTITTDNFPTATACSGYRLDHWENENGIPLNSDDLPATLSTAGVWHPFFVPVN